MSQMDNIMAKRQKEMEEAYEAMWDEGRGSHHPDYDPEATGLEISNLHITKSSLYYWESI